MYRHSPGTSRSRWRFPAALLALAVGLLPLARPAAAERRLDIDKLESSYVAALELLAKGDRDGALEALMELELEALGSVPSTGRIDRVWRHKLAVVRRALEMSSPEVLIPVIVLHHDAYGLYREANQPVLARHARDMATDLAAYKVQSTKTDADKRFAGWVMASFGESMLTLRTSSTSAGILQDALDLSPYNPAALLGLAWAHEAHGEYEEASERLAKLLEVEPDHQQARLRWAACQRRLGNLRAAEDSLTKLLKESAEPWIRSIAYQELARTLISQERLDAAESVVREAYEEFPAEQEIAILLASLSERLGRLSEADRIIARIEPAGPGSVSARFIYDGRPDLGIEKVRSDMQTMMNERLDVLATGLRWWGDDGTETEESGSAGGEG